ncbi:VanZ family protein [Lentzea cavernae]|uniref:VanZ-like domain-containing protein n=1 Tax=Lentzea cavernae TaxID=2020703 RepID=A0ABQ3MDP6_9PSEU|nr:VanZ family protein [Lentzea cavernae]GHH32959.1 hypothetical protein GCM10017774_14660 [Lentzea cavernae]
MLNTWQEWVGTETGVVLGAVLGLPAAVLVMLLLGLHRKLRERPSPWRTAMVDVGLFYGTLPWVWLLLLPGSSAELSLVPFADIIDLVAHRDVGQIVGNLLVFAALGFFGPLRFEALRSVWRVLVVAGACSTLIEIAQFTALHRVSSVDDVLLNAVGAAMASMLSWWWWRAKPAVVADRRLVAV